MWTWRDEFQIWRHNWIKRPWRNFLWDLPFGDGERVRREHPDVRIPRLGKLSRQTMEWARAVFADADAREI